MTRTRSGLVKLVAVAAVSFTPACGQDNIPVAVIVDSGIDAMRIPCGPWDGGACEAGWFCDSTSGACDFTGFCDKVPPPDSCADGGFAPECGCNGVSYFNGCLRLAARASRYTTSGCYALPPPQMAKTCDTKDSTGMVQHGCDGNESCALISQIPYDILSLSDAGLSSDSRVCRGIEATPLAGFGFCWVLPDTCPLSSGHGLRACGEPCIDSCKALKGGGTYYNCSP